MSEDHEKAIQAVNAELDKMRAASAVAGGLRVPRAICDQLAAPAQATGDRGRDDYLAGTVQLPKEVEDFLWSEANRADQVVEQARACQNWIREQGFYGDAGQ